MTSSFTRRGFGGLALGAISAGPLRAQSADDLCSRSEEWGNWEVTADYVLIDGTSYYTLDLQHLASGIWFRFESDDADRILDGRVSVWGFSKIYNDVDWFSDDVLENGGRSLEVTLADPTTGYRWEVRGRATSEVSPSTYERYGSVDLNISEAQARDLFNYMSRNETQVAAEAKLVLDDGRRHSASTWKMTTNGLGVLDGRGPGMFREIVATTVPEDCLGSCFVTTACCAEFGRPDDGVELKTLRGFRDNWLIRQPGGAEDIATYYLVAPRICAAIAAHPRGRLELARVYATGILPCVLLIKLGLFRAARGLYRWQMERLQARYGTAPARQAGTKT